MMPHSIAPARWVFVYGTLRRGGHNDIARYRPAASYVADAEIAGTLYDLGAYPGAVLGGDGRVFGEIYEITPAVEAQLDLLEDVKADGTGEYFKREVRVWTGKQHVDCLVYEIHPDRVRDAPVIRGGNWFVR